MENKKVINARFFESRCNQFNCARDDEKNKNGNVNPFEVFDINNRNKKR